MKKTLLSLFFFISLTLTAQSIRHGYVLKPDEGEKPGSKRTIKGRPKSGTQGGVMIIDKLPPGFETTFHVHDEADEFFYVINGDGTAEFDGKEQNISTGYVIFVPAGGEHKLKVS
ncbi:cupin domain-containing protein [Marinoscillum sp. MHG1-6]|uniref:cupin domain-containing protein n=1 Tax=Marinoscillum sp. MHG1-6 TaxID=2959627 RepID=UPI0021573E41|nr:cupin domain-containing protein [Marinoscillum sp. MHG1-6]